jgi:CelD/BcsL family acetyltransferase involved in cellulose biosynthesis
MKAVAGLLNEEEAKTTGSSTTSHAFDESAGLASEKLNDPSRSAQTVNNYTLQPLLDSRWDDLAAHHPEASVFHQRGWLEALKLTYGYEPLVLTKTPVGSPLEGGLVYCRVSSWMTGTRLVSLPFADHCQPLVSNPDEAREYSMWLRDECDRNHQQYVELRPSGELQISEVGLKPTDSYWLHELRLDSSLEQIFRRLHKNSFQRKIRRAEREKLSYEVGRSRQLVDEFYSLLLMTRRRHHLLPQPRSWFRNLVECMGDKAVIRLARKGGQAVAAMLTLRHGSAAVYKYGCSDAALHNLGGMPFLFWRFIEECKSSGIERIDFGRSDLDHKGLIAFKDRLGAKKTLLTYQRYTSIRNRQGVAPWRYPDFRDFFCNLPDVYFSTAGRVLYRHMG